MNDHDFSACTSLMLFAVYYTKIKYTLNVKYTKLICTLSHNNFKSNETN